MGKHFGVTHSLAAFFFEGPSPPTTELFNSIMAERRVRRLFLWPRLARSLSASLLNYILCYFVDFCLWPVMTPEHIWPWRVTSMDRSFSLSLGCWLWAWGLTPLWPRRHLGTLPSWVDHPQRLPGIFLFSGEKNTKTYLEGMKRRTCYNTLSRMFY